MIAFIVLPVLYVLSPPFIVLLYENLPPGIRSSFKPVLEIFFLPLQWLYDNVEFVEKFYNWYETLFGVI